MTMVLAWGNEELSEEPQTSIERKKVTIFTITDIVTINNANSNKKSDTN